MTKNDKIYHITSVCAFVLHICVFVFVVVVGFLPYQENKNFYEIFSGYFGNVFSSFHPILMLAILLISCVFSYFTINRPHLSFWAGILSFVFFLLEVLPYSFEIAFVSLLSRVGEIGISTYQIGFKLISGAAYIIYFDIAFFVYSIITLFIRSKTNS